MLQMHTLKQENKASKELLGQENKTLTKRLQREEATKEDPPGTHASALLLREVAHPPGTRASALLLSKAAPKSTAAHGAGTTTPIIFQEDKNQYPKGPGDRTSTPLPPLPSPKLASSGGDLEQQVERELSPTGCIKSNTGKMLMPRELHIPPRASIKVASNTIIEVQKDQAVDAYEDCGCITSNAFRGLPNENSIRDHGDDDDITTASPTEYNELSKNKTKEVHKCQVIDAFGERGLYTGKINIKSHMPDGYGDMQYHKKGRSYQGDWCQGHWHGLGKFLNGLEDRYEGEFVMDQKHGQGKLFFSDGSVFTGHFEENEMRKGKLYSSGSIYEGEFAMKGQKHGQGKLIFNDSRVFTGRFLGDKMREGKLYYQDGSSYQGLLKDGKRCGFGLYFFSDESQYGGQWENDLFHGRGRMDWCDGSWYNGDWEVGLQHGIGLDVLPDGTIRHKGKWYKGNPVHEAAVPIG